MTADQCAIRQAARENLVHELADALQEAIDIIGNICCSDNSCELPMDLTDLKDVLAKARGEQS